MEKLERRKQVAALYPLTDNEIVEIAWNHPKMPLKLEQKGCRDLVPVSLYNHFARDEKGWFLRVRGIEYRGADCGIKWRLWAGKPDIGRRREMPWRR